MNDDFLKTIWEDAFEEALEAEENSVLTKQIKNLTWEEVFDKEY